MSAHSWGAAWKQHVSACFYPPAFEDVQAIYCKRALFIFSKYCFPRRQLILLTHLRVFEIFILTAIGVNCVTLALESNAPGFRETQLGRQLYKIDLVFLAVFTLEAVFKIIAMGLLMAPNTYLRNGWNVLDVVIVGIGYISLVGFASVNALRALRSLRPLRTVSRIKGMKNISSALIASIPALGDVMLLMFIYFSVFGIMGVLLVGGGLRSRCGYPEFNSATTDASGTVQGVRYVVPEANMGTICHSPSTDLISWHNKTDPATGHSSLVPQGVEAADGWSYHCDTTPSEAYPFGQFCTPSRNPGAGDLPADVPGFISCDNILQAWLTVLQHVTLTDWAFLMYDVQDGVSWWMWTLHFFVAFLGGMLLINLVVAVIFISYERGIQSLANSEDDSEMLALMGAMPNEDNPGVVSSNGSTDGEADLKVERNTSASVAPLLYGTPELPIPSERDAAEANFGAKAVAEGREDDGPLQQNQERAEKATWLGDAGFASVTGGWIGPTPGTKDAVVGNDAAAAVAAAAAGEGAPAPNSPPSSSSPSLHGPSGPTSHSLMETTQGPGTPSQSPSPRAPSNPTTPPPRHQHKPAARRFSEPCSAFLAHQGSTPPMRPSGTGYGRTGSGAGYLCASSVARYSHTGSSPAPGRQMHKRASMGDLGRVSDVGDSGKARPRRTRRHSSVAVELASHNYRPFDHSNSQSSNAANASPYSRRMSNTGSTLGCRVCQEGVPPGPDPAAGRPQSLPEFPDFTDLHETSEEDDGMAVQRSALSRSAPKLATWHSIRDSKQRLSAVFSDVRVSGDCGVQKCVSMCEPNKEVGSTKEEVTAHLSASHPSLWGSLRAYFNNVVDSQKFELFTCAVIAANAVTLGLNWYLVPEPLERAVHILNYAFTCYFVVEIILRVSAKGRDFFTTRMNWFDFLVTCASLVEMVVELAPGSDSAAFNGGLTAIRLLRLFRLARYWAGLGRILRILSHAFTEGVYLLALVLLFMFVMGLLGMQFFGYQIAWCGKMEGATQRCPPGMDCPSHRECYVDCRPEQLGEWFEVDHSPYNGLAYCERFPRDFDPSSPSDNPEWPLYWAQVGKPDIGSQHFDNMLHSFITVFIIITLDNWTDIMYTMMSLISPWIALYFVALIVLGSFMLLQLFLAILLGSLDKLEEEEEKAQNSKGATPVSHSLFHWLESMWAHVTQWCSQSCYPFKTMFMSPPAAPPKLPPGILPGLEHHSSPDAGHGQRAPKRGVSFDLTTVNSGDSAMDGPSFLLKVLESSKHPWWLKRVAPASCHDFTTGHCDDTKPMTNTENGTLLSVDDIYPPSHQLSSDLKATLHLPQATATATTETPTNTATMAKSHPTGHGTPTTGLPNAPLSRQPPSSLDPSSTAVEVLCPTSPLWPTSTPLLVPQVPPQPNHQSRPIHRSPLGQQGSGAPPQRVSFHTPSMSRSQFAAPSLPVVPSPFSATSLQHEQGPRKATSVALGEGTKLDHRGPLANGPTFTRVVPLEEASSNQGHGNEPMVPSTQHPQQQQQQQQEQEQQQQQQQQQGRIQEQCESAMLGLPFGSAVLEGQSPCATAGTGSVEGCLSGAQQRDNRRQSSKLAWYPDLVSQSWLFRGSPTNQWSEELPRIAISPPQTSREDGVHTHHDVAHSRSWFAQPLKPPPSAAPGLLHHVEYPLESSKRPVSPGTMAKVEDWKAAGRRGTGHPTSEAEMAFMPSSVEPTQELIHHLASEGEQDAAAASTALARAAAAHSLPPHHHPAFHRRFPPHQTPPGHDSLSPYVHIQDGDGAFSRVCHLHQPSPELPLSSSPLQVQLQQPPLSKLPSQAELPLQRQRSLGSRGSRSRSGDLLEGSRDMGVLLGQSLNCMGPDHPLRLWAATVVNSTPFERFYIFVLLVSCVVLMLDVVSLDPSSTKALVLRNLDAACTAVFGLEALLRIINMGLLFNGPHSYLRSGWNQIDLFVVATSVVVLTIDASNAESRTWLNTLRALRALRVLKVAARSLGVQVVLEALKQLLPALVDVLWVGLLFYYIFAVLAVALLSGKMHYCAEQGGDYIDPYYVLPAGETLTKGWCEHSDSKREGSRTVTETHYHSQIGVNLPPYELTTSWTRDLNRFDNVVTAIWVLYQMASVELWSNIMSNAQNAVGRERQPLRDANSHIGLFFIIFMVIGSLTLLSLIVGVSIRKFHELKKESDGQSPLLTMEQQQWLSIQMMISSTAVEEITLPSDSPIRRAAHLLAYNPLTDKIMMFVILANVIVMFFAHYGMGPKFEQAIMITNVIVTAFFVAEFTVKVVAVGLLTYLKNRWNVFDVVITVLSVASVLIENLSPDSVAFLPVLRVLRVIRLLKIIPNAKGVRKLINAIYWSLPAVYNVAVVLLLFMYLWAIVGMNLFGNIKLQDNPASISRPRNFQHFPVAMITVFTILTGENWNDAMHGAMVKEDCYLVQTDISVTLPRSDGTMRQVDLKKGQYLDPVDDHALIDELPQDVLKDECTINSMLAVLYFCIYMLVCTYIMIQLVIGIVLDNVQTATFMEGISVGQDQVLNFVSKWKEFDPYGTSYISVKQLTALLQELPPQLGVMGLPQPQSMVQQIIFSVDIPLRKGINVHFLEVLHALAGRVAGAELPAEEERRVHHRFSKTLPEGGSSFTAAQVYAAMVVSGAIKGFLQRFSIRDEDYGNDDEGDTSGGTPRRTDWDADTSFLGKRLGKNLLHTRGWTLNNNFEPGPGKRRKPCRWGLS